MRIGVRRRGVAFAIVVAAAAGASSCSDAPAEPFTLPGTYRSLVADGRFMPVVYDAYLTGFPRTLITGAKLEIFPTDSMYVTTYYKRVDASGIEVIAPWSERFIIWGYSQAGDSLYEDSPGGPIPFGEIVGGRLDVVIRYALPPSEGYPFLTHAYRFTK